MVTLEERITELLREHGGLRPAARAVRLDPGYLEKLRGGKKRNPSDATLAKLGLEKRVTYVLK